MPTNNDIKNALILKVTTTIEEWMAKRSVRSPLVAPRGRSLPSSHSQSSSKSTGRIPSVSDVDVSVEINSLVSLSPKDRLSTAVDAIRELIDEKKFFAAILLIPALNDIIVAAREEIKNQPPASGGNEHTPPPNNGGQTDPVVPPPPPPPQPEPPPTAAGPDGEGYPFTYENRSRARVDVLFMDPSGVFASKEAGVLWFNSLASEMFGGEYQTDAGPDDVRLGYGLGILKNVLLESPNFWRPGTLPTFNKIILGSNPDGTGGTAIMNEDLSGRSIQPPTLTDPQSSEMASFPQWFILGSNFQNDLGNITDLRNFAVADDAQLSDFPMSVHVFGGKAFGLFFQPLSGTAIALVAEESAILDGQVFIDKLNVTIRKQRTEGHTYDVTKNGENTWRLTPEGVTFRDLASLKLKNEIPGLARPLVWRKNPLNSVWQEIPAEFDSNNNALITTTEHFSNWVLDEDTLLFRVNDSIKVRENDGVARPDGIKFYEVYVDDVQSTTVEFFERKKEDYLIQYAVFDDEDNPGWKRANISYEYDAGKYETYRNNAYASFQNGAQYNASRPYFITNQLSEEIRLGTNGVWSELGDRAVAYPLLFGMISYVTFFEKMLEAKDYDLKNTWKYANEHASIYFLHQFREELNNAIYDSESRLTSTQAVINDPEVLSNAVQITADAQPVAPGPDQIEQIRFDILTYHSSLLPFLSRTHEKLMAVRDAQNVILNVFLRKENEFPAALDFENYVRDQRDMWSTVKEHLTTAAKDVAGFIDWYTSTHEQGRYSNTCETSTTQILDVYTTNQPRSMQDFVRFTIAAKYFHEDPICSSDRLTFESNAANDAYRLNKVLLIKPKNA